MAGFLGKLKSGADKAAFEADRLVRLNQAQSVLRGIQRELEAEVMALGQQALSLYDARALTQPELVALMPKIDSLRERITVQEAEVERIRQEKPPEASVPGEQAGGVAAAERAPEPAPPTPLPQGRVCAKCNTPLNPDVRFCPECGFRVADM